jgi:menaquinol-cytochrome c reductase iron-sulfur subunit
MELLKHPGESSNNDLSPEGKAAAHSRRVFLFKIAVLLNAAIGTVLAIPLVGFVISPMFNKSSRAGSWIKLGDVGDYPEGETRLAVFKSPVASLDDGETANIPCWVRNSSTGQITVFAINCAHLGCPVRWFAQSRLFLCPCHGGTYYEDGSRASGPPERGLFKYRSKIEGSSLLIHAGDMPTLATQASCKDKPLIQIAPAASNQATTEAATQARSTSWPA